MDSFSPGYSTPEKALSWRNQLLDRLATIVPLKIARNGQMVSLRRNSATGR